MLWIAVIAMMCATVSQHLGLTEAVSSVVSKIARCPMCCSMWVTLATLLYLHCDALIAISLSITMSYLSNYFGLVLVGLQKVYIWLRKRIEG